MAERILVLEGPKGTAIQTLELSEEDFRGRAPEGPSQEMCAGTTICSA